MSTPHLTSERPRAILNSLIRQRQLMDRQLMDRQAPDGSLLEANRRAIAYWQRELSRAQATER